MTQKNHQKAVKNVPNGAAPLVITGITLPPTQKTVSDEIVRFRVNFELSPSVVLCLEHVCEVTGSTKSQVINTALLDSLPALVDRADMLLKRGQALKQSNIAKHR